MPNNIFARAFRWSASVALATTMALGASFITDDSGIYVVTLAPGTTVMRLKLPAPASALADGTNYNTSVQAALNTWNAQLGVIAFSGVIDASTAYATGNGINEIVMDSKADGEAFDDTTLAVTFSYRSGNTRTESDIVFNSAKSWDSYRGPISGHGGQHDIRRVAIHEIGHVVGLGHPDEATPPQSVTAIMNSHVSDVEVQQADDIAGAQTLYGAPGFVPANDHLANATVFTLNGNTAQLNGTSVAGTKQPGEPNHANNTGGHSVWWKWTASGPGTMTLTTLGSNFDTNIAVYTGTVVNALTAVASNDDVTQGAVRTSAVSFPVKGGTTYVIAVDGWNGYFGKIVLNASFAADAPGRAPTITDPLGSARVAAGGRFTLAVNAGGGPTGYQWYFNGTPISGATSQTLTLSNVQSGNAGGYYVAVSNENGTTNSNTATLEVFAEDVSTQTVATGHDVYFAATQVAGSQIQWQLSTDGGVTWTNITNNSTYSGANSSALAINGATAAMNGHRYRYVLGNGTSSSNSAPFTLNVSAAFFSYPRAVAIDGSGNLYVGDSSNHVIQKITPANVITTLAGASGQTGTADASGTGARFNQPSGLSASPDGSLVVADTANATIRAISAGGLVTTFAGSTTNRGNADATGTTATFSSPLGLARDGAGNVYVADSTNHTIRKITPAGTVTTLAGSAGVSGSADGTGAAARFNLPSAVAVDGAGNVYVADTTNNTIRKITPAGAVTTLAGLAGVGGTNDGTGPGALFNSPSGIAVDGAGNVYVADTANSLIRKITADGASTTLAGLPAISGLKDGVSWTAWFNQPRALVWDGSSNLYVADTGNAVIRKIALANGAVTTLTLTAGSAGGSSGGGTTPPVTPPTSSRGGGGGGGSPSAWFVAALGALTLLRWRASWKHSVPTSKLQ